MDQVLFRSIVPYAVGLAIAAVLYLYAGTFDYAPRPGQLGPEVWPRLAILLMGGSCLFEILRRLIVGNQDAAGFLEAFDREPEVEDKQPVYPRLLVGGIVLMAIYAVLVPVLGFILGTFLFLAAFMYVGGYRAHWRYLGYQRSGDDLLRNSVPPHRLCFAAAWRSAIRPRYRHLLCDAEPLVRA